MTTANGWNGATIFEGQTVRVHSKDICGKRGCVTATVLVAGDFCEIKIVQASKSTSWEPGNRLTVGSWWLEPVAV